MSITPEDTSAATFTAPPFPGRVVVGGVAEGYQDDLLRAIESLDIDDMRKALSRVPGNLRKTVLFSPSKRMEFKLRTPLMAGATTADMPIMDVLLSAFRGLFRRGEATEKKFALGRGEEMARQLEIIDVDGMTLLMHASSSGSSAVFQAVSQQVRPSQFRKVIPAKDANGMTFLHHVVNTKSDSTVVPPTGARFPPMEDVDGKPDVAAPSSAEGGTAMAGQRGETPDNQPTPTAVAFNASSPDPWLPVVKSALEFAKRSLWMPEYRNLLLSRDAWNRSVVEHSIVSGRQQIFEAVFDAFRKDIHDEQIDLLLNTGVDSSYELGSMTTALHSNGGRKIAHLVAEKTKSLKQDVSRRAEDSTVASKIQSFIPGNLVIIFQLLLPEFKEESDQPLYLLLALCAITPLWALAASMSRSKDPPIKNSRASPAMFFWGIGTSSIGEVSFGWEATASAAALAVTTIVIPALDSFFSGRGSRKIVAAVVIGMLNFRDGSGEKRPCGKKSKRPIQIYGEDDDWCCEEQEGPPEYPSGGRTSPLVTSAPHPAGIARHKPQDSPGSYLGSMEEGGTRAVAARRNLAVLGRNDSPEPRLRKSQHSPTGSIWEEKMDTV